MAEIIAHPETGSRSAEIFVPQTPEAGNRKPEAFVPFWQRFSGLNPRSATTLPYAEYRQRALRLIEEFKRRVRAELDEEATNVTEPEIPNRRLETFVPPDSRTIYWDPLTKVLNLLQISRAMMSRLTKEFAGISALEMMDLVKADGLRERMELDARQFLRAAEAFFAIHPEDVPKKRNPFWSVRHDSYNLRRQSRIRGEFELVTWAIQHGFSNWSRFRKACLAKFRLTPQQIEMEFFHRVEQESCEKEGREFKQTIDRIDEAYIQRAKAKTQATQEAGAICAADTRVSARGPEQTRSASPRSSVLSMAEAAPATAAAPKPATGTRRLEPAVAAKISDLLAKAERLERNHGKPRIVRRLRRQAERLACGAS